MLLLLLLFYVFIFLGAITVDAMMLLKHQVLLVHIDHQRTRRNQKELSSEDLALFDVIGVDIS